MRRTPSVEELVEGICAGRRTTLARAITLVESSKPAHQAQARELLRAVRPYTGSAIRLGISGVPGVGKSTFINTFGLFLIDQGYRVGVVAVDPSSQRTGGSILGDRTRMADLAVREEAFIRPSPSGGHLGGVARATRESMLLLEAAGYDVIIVETVGVGQSEVAVADMVDTFLMLCLARTGDQLQGIKRGILELADVITMNKSDGDEMKAKQAARELSGALRLMRTDRSIPPPLVMTSSGLTGVGLEDVWSAVLKHRERLEKLGRLEERRVQQQRDWMWTMAQEEVRQLLRRGEGVAQVRDEVEEAVSAGTLSAVEGAARLLQAFAQDPQLSRWGAEGLGLDGSAAG
ncbi:methylmalonyl Co-A mutase-associated GTPase MeaB [Dermatophilus congolensis]|uniref:Probable GTPase Rv1496/MT1543 n=1 Tax=Dermatophilus congolensis TaxID=1863 RepID=A0AA46GZP1_9MICO|nr:methylmalonyl Co-A mutase-associated GTPase MeaB [Dermatophilus congolensis]MBO3142087.1 methylmalonyl Co-A mutase-associated GTPase MeaB [Dermatophilus congolensis]MBO3151078.1 methylmalonyl Co-A mutase-associated GTPase MeaB [Dermatophilus congolensis]MBO3161919.1 methylmalonyl Co-A mutase-associated GTPase MeaB [Dermatophilus congolensis]MBO3162362.1 methylmalonyl Co-A mutase-associated GTPase MeaB [Dermatophilus congolensis]MBO3175919.1 methylmalonyl Co-A mutase-associated GTPase MeaB [